MSRVGEAKRKQVCERCLLPHSLITKFFVVNCQWKERDCDFNLRIYLLHSKRIIKTTIEHDFDKVNYSILIISQKLG